MSPKPGPKKARRPRSMVSQTVSQKSKQNQTVNITLGNLGTRARLPRTTNPPQPKSGYTGGTPPPPPPSYSPSIIMYSPGLSNPAPFSAPIQQQTLGTSVSTPMNPPVSSRVVSTGSELLNREPSLPPGQSYRLHTRLDPSTPIASRVILSSSGSELLNMEQNIPPVQAYRLPPMLDTIPADPVIIRQNARPNPFRDPIEPSLPEFEGRAQETDLRNFEEIRAMNDLIKKENDPYNNIDDEQQNITDSYNANQYASLDPAISDDADKSPDGDTIPPPEPPTEMYSPPPRGRPIMTPTEQEIETLRQFVRTKNIPAKQRNPQDAALFREGQMLRAAKRNNPIIKEILDQLTEAYENSGK